MFSILKLARQASTKLKHLREIRPKLAKMSMQNIEVCRFMVPDDANMSGNVHGGTILKMIEEAGVIIATRHCNKGQSLTQEQNTKNSNSHKC